MILKKKKKKKRKRKHLLGQNWESFHTQIPNLENLGKRLLWDSLSSSQTKLFLLLLYCFKPLNNYLIDLNTTEEDETPSSGSSSTSSSSFSVARLNTSGGSSSNLVVGASASTSAASSSSVCLELQHVCAGPLISLPKKGSVVVYFPQSQLE